MEEVTEFLKKYSCSNCEYVKDECAHIPDKYKSNQICREYKPITIKYPFNFLEACSQAKEQGCKIVSEYRENLGHNPKYHICYFKYDILVNCNDMPPELEAKEIAGKWRLISE